MSLIAVPRTESIVLMIILAYYVTVGPSTCRLLGVEKKVILMAHTKVFRRIHTWRRPISIEITFAGENTLNKMGMGILEERM